MDYFQDTLYAIEDGFISGKDVCIAWNYSDEDLSKTPDHNEKFVKFDITIPYLMGWLTGQRHKASNFDDLKIKVHFNHHCMKESPGHTICYPLVSACTNEITFPVAHMNSEERFKETFVTACINSHSFGRH